MAQTSRIAYSTMVNRAHRNTERSDFRHTERATEQMSSSVSHSSVRQPKRQLSGRLEAWLNKPVAEQRASLADFLRLETIKTLTAHGRIFHNQEFRRWLFDGASSGSLLVSNGDLETFIVSAADRSIGRPVFLTRQPYSFDKLEAVSQLLDPNHKRALLVDIGANIGTICIPAIKRGLFQRAIAIEPEPRNHSLLVANISINMLAGRIISHNVALGRQNDESLMLDLSADNHGDHRIRASNASPQFNETTRTTIEIRSETFDKVVQEVDPAATLIWVDTQGFEGYVLSGASRALKARTPICLEFWPYGMARSGCYAALKDALLSNGYRRFFDLKNLASGASPLSAEALDALYDTLGEAGKFTDLLVV